jgi:hypothetical protein
LAGAIAGLAASGIAATFYATNCTDDSPLFVITWYPLATGFVALTLFEWASILAMVARAGTPAGAWDRPFKRASSNLIRTVEAREIELSSVGMLMRAHRVRDSSVLQAARVDPLQRNQAGADTH